MTAMAAATFPDGTLPAVADVVHAATFLFGAGQETTARLLATSMMILAKDKESRTACAETAIGSRSS